MWRKSESRTEFCLFKYSTVKCRPIYFLVALSLRPHPRTLFLRNGSSTLRLQSRNRWGKDFRRFLKERTIPQYRETVIRKSTVFIASGSGSRLIVPPDPGFCTTNLINFLVTKNIVAINFFCCLHEGFPSFRRSLQLLKENVQFLKKISLFLLRVIFVFLDLDPQTQVNRIQSGFRIQNTT